GHRRAVGDFAQAGGQAHDQGLADRARAYGVLRHRPAARRLRESENLMSVRTESNQIACEQAAHWIELLNSGEILSKGELQSFHSWLQVPSNARAFHEYQFMVGLIEGLPKDKQASLVNTIVPQEPRFPALRALFAQPFKLSAAAAALAAVAAVATWLGLRPAAVPSVVYSTNTGEERTVVLPDGSVAHLNTQSRLRWI